MCPKPFLSSHTETRPSFYSTRWFAWEIGSIAKQSFVTMGLWNRFHILNENVAWPPRIGDHGSATPERSSPNVGGCGGGWLPVHRSAAEPPRFLSLSLCRSNCQWLKLHRVWLLWLCSFRTDCFNLGSPESLVFYCASGGIRTWSLESSHFHTPSLPRTHHLSFLKNLNFLLVILSCKLCLFLLSFNAPFSQRVAFD